MNEKIKETILDALYEQLASAKDKVRLLEMSRESRSRLTKSGHTKSIRERALRELESLETHLKDCQANMTAIEDAIAFVENATTK